MNTTCMECKKHNSNAFLSPWCKKCEEDMNSWDDRQNQSLSGKNTLATKRSASGEKTPATENGNLQNVSYDMKPTPKNTELRTEQNTMQTKKNETSNEPNGLDETRRSNLNTTETITEKTLTTFEPSFTLPEIKETQLVEFTESFSDLKTEVSASINLLSQSEKELFDSMKGLRSSQPEPATRMYDTERVQTAVMCGRQIAESMKTKLELFKFYKDLK